MNPEGRGTYYAFSKDKLSKYRVDAMLDAYSKGTTAPVDLDRVRKLKQNHMTDIIGMNTEVNFLNYASDCRIISEVRKSSIDNDIYAGFDFWIKFQDYLDLPSLPVQVKSSMERVEKFKVSRRFQDVGGLVIVLNCGQKIKTKRSFELQLNKEVNRIRTLIKDS